MDFSEKSLVMLRLPTKFGYSNTWWRVLFRDNDDTFIGKLERFHWLEYTDYKKHDVVRWDNNKVQSVWNGEQFCTDNITFCSCEGKCCRNK